MSESKHPALEGWEIRVSELPGPAFENVEGRFYAEIRNPDAGIIHRDWLYGDVGETRDEAIDRARTFLIREYEKASVREAYLQNRRNPISQEVVPA